MNKILSQDEINALFSAMSSEEGGMETTDHEKRPRYKKVFNFDFHRADDISLDQMRSIQMLHELFTRSFTSSLSAYLKTVVDILLINLEQLPYADFLKKLPNPTLFARVGMSPLDENLVLEMSPTLVFPMIDMILGKPKHNMLRSMTLTEIEMNIIDDVLGLAMRDLQRAWSSVIDLNIFVEDRGTKAQLFQVVSPYETVIAVHLELKIGDNSGTMNLCIPSRVLKQISNIFDQQCCVPTVHHNPVKVKRAGMEKEMGTKVIVVEESGVETPAFVPVAAYPEGSGKGFRRRFSAAYKRRILQEADKCNSWELGVLLRREGLYHSNLTTWRKQRQSIELSGLQPKKRREKPKTDKPLIQENKRLRRENMHLKKRLRQAETIIDVQNKLCDRANSSSDKAEREHH